MAKYGAFKYGRAQYGTASFAKAGVTNHVVMDNVGLNITGVLTKSDITSSIPRISVGTDQRKHTDFSERDTWGQSSYHHGRGALVIQDPFTFYDARNLVTWLPNQLTLAPDDYYATNTSGDVLDLAGEVTDCLEYAGNLYFLVSGTLASGNALYLYNNASSGLQAVSAGLDTSSADPRDLHAFGGDMYVAQGEGVNARRFDGSSWTDMGYPCTRFASFDDRLWRADNINELFQSQNPDSDAAAQWSEAYEIGDSSYPIRSLVGGWNNALWVGKDDGIYSITGSQGVYTPVKVIDLSALGSINAVDMHVYGGNLYITIGTSLMRFDGTTIQFMGPDRGANETSRFTQANTQFGLSVVQASTETLPATFQSGVVGQVSRMTHDGNFLYAAVDNDDLATSYVMVWGSTGWHVVHAAASTTRITSVFYTKRLASSGNLSYPVLWWSEGTYLRFQKWGAFGQNPLDDSRIEYADSGYLITGWYDAGLMDVDKAFFDWVSNGLDLSVSGNSITVEFQVDNFNTWYTLGTIYQTPDGHLTFPDGTAHGPTLFAKKIRYRITLTRGATATSTPVLYSWGHRFITRPVARYGWTFIVRAYDNMYNLLRRDESDRAESVRQFIYGLRDKRTPIQFFDGTELDSVTNSIQNPSVELDSNGDGTADGITAVSTVTLTRTAQYKSRGVLSQKVALSGSGTKGIAFDDTVTVEIGRAIYAAADVFVQSGDNITMQILNSSSEVVASNTFYRVQPDFVATHFTRKSIYYVAEEADTYSLRIVRDTDSGASSTVFFVDGVEFITDEVERMVDYANENNVPSYIDGDQLRCSWNGTPHDSTSTRQQGYLTYITNLTESFRYEEQRVNRTVFNTEITISMREMQ